MDNAGPACVTRIPLLQRLNPSPQMTGCQVRIAQRHLDIAMPGQCRHFRQRSSRLDQAADEGMPERVQTHAGQLRLFRRANDGHTHLFQGVGASIRVREHVRRALSRLPLQ